MAPASQQPSTGIKNRAAIAFLAAVLLPCLWNIWISVFVDASGKAASPLWFSVRNAGDGDGPAFAGSRRLDLDRDDSDKDSWNENDESHHPERTPVLKEEKEEVVEDNKQNSLQKLRATAATTRSFHTTNTSSLPVVTKSNHTAENRRTSIDGKERQQPTHSAGLVAEQQVKQQQLNIVDAHADAAAGKYNTSWCILDNGSTPTQGKFRHFPHAMQSLGLCWSWFLRQPATNRRGLYVKGRLGKFLPPEKDWRAALAFHMGCDLQYSNHYLPIGFPSYRPSFQDVKGKKFFFQPEDAAALRDRLYADKDNSTNQTWSGLHIGIVQRLGSRKILNMDAIEAAIRKAYPSALIERAHMEELTPLQQFHWWAWQDIVLAAHGAALTNLVFLHRNAALVEIFPPHYYSPEFWKLGKATGLRNYGYFNGVKDPIADFNEHGREFKARIALRAVDLEPPVDAVLGLVKQAVTEETSGTYREREKYNMV